MATQTETQRKTAARKAAATRRRNAAKRGQSATRSAATRTQTSAARTAETAAQTAETRAKAEASALRAVQSQAERAVLIPVGAALVARDAVIDATKPFTASRESAEKELERVGNRVAVNLRKFERRGSTARNRAVREVKRTRTRVERELRRNRRGLGGPQGRSRAPGQGDEARGAEPGGDLRLPRGLARLGAQLPPGRLGEGGPGVGLPATYLAGSAVSLLPQ